MQNGSRTFDLYSGYRSSTINQQRPRQTAANPAERQQAAIKMIPNHPVPATAAGNARIPDPAISPTMKTAADNSDSPFMLSLTTAGVIECFLDSLAPIVEYVLMELDLQHPSNLTSSIVVMSCYILNLRLTRNIYWM